MWVGTDCSGIEAPLWALRNLGIPFEHVFSSDKCPNARKMIRANFSPRHLFKDITAREHAPPVDLYVAGWPCQGNSTLGKRLGLGDSRSLVFWSVIGYMREHRPKLVLLENVANLLHIRAGQDMAIVLETLEQLNYNIYWRVLNTKDHGIPQNRPRLYFVCLRKDVDQGTFQWPEPLPPPGIEEFLDTAEPDVQPLPDTKAGKTFAAMLGCSLALGANPQSEPWLFDLRKTAAFARPLHNLCPCLLTRCDIWVSNRCRTLRLAEKCRLQGLDPDQLRVVVSKTALARQLGNSMSANVLERILCRALPAAGLTAPLRDRWGQ